MSEIVEQAVAILNDKMGAEGFDGSAKFVFEGEGSLVIDQSGARASDEEAEVTLTASAETFKAILDGELNPTAAFMTGRLSVDGNMGMALKLSSVLA